MKKTKYSSIIVGGGEIGTSLKNVLLELHKKHKKYSLCVVDIKDNDYKTKLVESECETMHVSIPFFDQEKFVKEVIAYDKCFNPKLIIIHSTVIPGTTAKIRKSIKKHVSFSPVRGNHPFLEKYIKGFVKYFSCPKKETAMLVFAEMPKIRLHWYQQDEALELAKLLCTTYYGVCISWHREMERFCHKYKVDFELIQNWNQTYNEGYAKTKPNVIRPVLDPPSGPIGGHCVVPNAKLLKKIFKSPFLNLIK